MYIDDRFYLRELTKEEFHAVTNYKKDEAAITRLYEQIAKDQSLKKMEEAHEKARKLLMQLEVTTKAFGIYDDDIYAGYISFANYNTREPEIQIELQEEYRSRGIGYKALRLLIRKIFDERKDVAFLIYCVRVDNLISIKLVEKLGGKLIQSGDFFERLIKRYHILRDSEERVK